MATDSFLPTLEPEFNALSTISYAYERKLKSEKTVEVIFLSEIRVKSYESLNSGQYSVNIDLTSLVCCY